jgi:hypothetical protein
MLNYIAIFVKIICMNILNSIKFEDASKSGGVIKATIHKTGKLGFSAAAQEFLQINDESRFLVGFNDEDIINNEIIYLVPDEDVERAFKVAKGGEYYYLNLKYTFDKRGIDYKIETIIFDIKKQKENEVEYYILKKRK